MQIKQPEQLVEDFFNRVWTPPNDLEAINELMTEDYELYSAGTIVKGREAFKQWVDNFHKILLNPQNKILESFSNSEKSRVVSRWICSGINNGIFGLPADQNPISFSGIAIWSLQNGKFNKCWVERSAFEVYKKYF